MTTTATATGRTYAIDPVHSEIAFSISHLLISKVRGNFTGFTGTLTLSDGDVPTQIDGSVEATSIHTRDEKRDGHLRSPDFFDVENFPSITFTSTSVSGAANDLTIVGNLTMHGATNSVTLKGELGGRTTDPWGNDRVAFSATGKVQRSDYGLTFGAGMLGEEVTVFLEIQAVLAK